MELSKSIDFLLQNAGPVIQYRLHKEILKDINKTEEENLLDKVIQTPYYKLVESYVKPNGYIGSGAHSWGKWRGVVFQPTYLADGEACARLLSNYAIPKSNILVHNFVNAMRNEETLKQEFTYIPPEIPRYTNRNKGLNSGSVSSDIMVLMYTMQSMLGYGDDEYTKGFQDISLNAFASLFQYCSIDEIAKIRKGKNKTLYIDESTYFPCSYHLTTLAHTKSWRTPQNVNIIANAINHLNGIMSADNCLSVKSGNKYYGAGWAFARPLSHFIIERIEGVMYRRVLTEIAMLGVGIKVDILSQSAENLKQALSKDGILKWEFTSKFQKSQFRAQKWPTAYCDIWLEENHKKANALECDLTFWAVQFLSLVEEEA